MDCGKRSAAASRLTFVRAHLRGESGVWLNLQGLSELLMLWGVVLDICLVT